ncbi:MAG: hypothetical protein PGN21_13015 [Sphingomonas paucimobilis]
MALIQAATAPLPAGVEDDVTCIAVLSIAANGATAEQQSGLISGLMYFMGRVDRAAPGFDYGGYLARMIKTKDGDATIQAASPRCSAKLIEVGGSMERWGEALQRKDEK